MSVVNRCTGYRKNGRPCSNEALTGQVFCGLHMPKELVTDPEVVLMGLMQETDKRVRLRAATAYIRMLANGKRECPKCAALKARHRENDDAVDRMTPEQKDEFVRLFTQLRELRRQALTQDVNA